MEKVHDDGGLMTRVWDVDKFYGNELFELWAKSAYAIADAMLVARSTTASPK